MHLHRRVSRSTPVWIEEYPPQFEGEEETFYLVVFDSHEVRESRAPYMGEAPLEIGAPPASHRTGPAYRHWWAQHSNTVAVHPGCGIHGVTLYRWRSRSRRGA